MLSRRKKIPLSLSLLAVTFLTVASCSIDFPSEKMAEAAQLSRSLPGRTFTSDGIHYLSTGSTSSDTTIFFVHGTPGNMDSWGYFMDHADLTQKARLVAMDRLGFGSSHPEAVQTSLTKQTVALQKLAQTFPGKRIWVGHSYGVPVIARLAADRPDLVDALLLIAGPADPDVAKPRIYHRLGNTTLGKALISDSLGKANDEMLALTSQLTDLAPYWPTASVPVTVIHAKNDILANWKNALYLQRTIPADKLRFVPLEDANHFLLWNSVETITDELSALVEKLGN